MQIYPLVLLAALLFVAVESHDSFHGYEDVIVTIHQGQKESKFFGAITQLPHTEGTLLWMCDKMNAGKTNLLEVLGITDEKEFGYPLTQSKKGFVLPYEKFQKKIIQQRNELNLPLVTLLERGLERKVVISYQTNDDRSYTHQLLQQVSDNLGREGRTPDQEFINYGMEGVDQYADSFCNRAEAEAQHNELMKMYQDDL